LSQSLLASAGSADRDMRRPAIDNPAISVATIAAMMAVVLIYVSGSFVVAEIVGAKRSLQVILIVPLAIVAAYYWIHRPRHLIEPLIVFVLVKTAAEIFYRGQWIWMLDGLATLFALSVLFCAPRRSVETAARLVVIIAGVFALMALVQGVLLFTFPYLGGYGLHLSEEGTIVNSVEHPIALLGLFSEQQYTLLGQGVGRLQSFAKEPSLNVVYFLLPASIAFFVDGKVCKFFGVAILIFCVLSLSGSIYLSLAFAALWWLLLRVVAMKLAFRYGLPLLMVLYLYVIRQFGLQPLFDGITYVAQYGDFLNKGASLTNRGTGAVANMDTALASPFGSPVLSDIPGPWLVNTALGAGWLGVLLLLVFLGQLAGRLELLNRTCGPLSAPRIASLLLLGTMSTVVVFSDYQMSNYAGLTLLGIAYRMIGLRNDEITSRAHGID
jgi:hypothetical protein